MVPISPRNVRETGRSCGHLSPAGAKSISGLSRHRPVDGGTPAAGAARRAGTPPGTAGDQSGCPKAAMGRPVSRGRSSRLRALGRVATWRRRRFRGRRWRAGHRHAGRRFRGLAAGVGGDRLDDPRRGGGGHGHIDGGGGGRRGACHRRRPGDGESFPSGGDGAPRGRIRLAPPLLPVAEAAQRLHVGGGSSPRASAKCSPGFGVSSTWPVAHPQGLVDRGPSRLTFAEAAARFFASSAFAASPWPWRPTRRSPDHGDHDEMRIALPMPGVYAIRRRGPNRPGRPFDERDPEHRFEQPRLEDRLTLPFDPQSARLEDRGPIAERPRRDGIVDDHQVPCPDASAPGGFGDPSGLRDHGGQRLSSSSHPSGESCRRQQARAARCADADNS